MTQEMTGQAAPPAPAPTPGPATGSSAGGESLSIPRSAMPQEYGNDWHQAFGHAKRYRPFASVLDRAEELGMTPEALAAAWNSYVENQERQQQQPPGVPAAPQALTEARLTEILEKQFMPKVQQALGQSLQQQRQQTEREQTLSAARQQRHDFIVKQMKDMGVELAGPDGKPTPHGRMVYKEFCDAIREHMASTAPAGLEGEALNDFLARPSQEHLAKAAESMVFIKDMQMSALSAAARRQAQIPATLGSGPGGSEPTQSFEKLSPAQQMDAVMAGVDVPDSLDE